MTGLRTLGIIQARMSSTRLPGKVLRPVLGKPLLQHMVERLRPARSVDRWVVATSTDASDEPIAAWCASAGTDCFRGSLHDVLDRFYRCAAPRAPQAIVRVTADCPLHHFEVVDTVAGWFVEQGADYATNSFAPVFEDGFDTEVMRFEVLQASWQQDHAAEAREHVTWAIRQDPRWARYCRKVDPGYALKLSVDTEDDFAVVSRIIESLAPGDALFSMAAAAQCAAAQQVRT